MQLGEFAQSIGVDIWQMTHPSQVQAEAQAVGAPVPSVASVEGQSALDLAVQTNPLNPGADIYAAAGQSVSSAAGETASAARSVGSAVATGAQWLIIGLIALAVLSVSEHAKT